MGIFILAIENLAFMLYNMYYCVTFQVFLQHIIRKKPVQKQ